MSTETENTVTTTQVYRVYIRATAEAIWDAITKPEWTQRYGYGGSAEYDLRSGGVYRSHASEEMVPGGGVAVDGEVIEADPPRKLVQTWRMLMDPGLTAEGFTRHSYDIKEGKGGVCTLTVTHDLTDAPRLAALLAGENEDQGAGGGWTYVLSGLKTLLETGEQLDWPW